jgi:hypothetical protein
MGLGMGIGCEDFGVSAAHAAIRNGMAKAIKRIFFSWYQVMSIEHHVNRFRLIILVAVRSVRTGRLLG